VRVDELLHHHEQRLAAVAARVAAGRHHAFAIAWQLSWTRRERRLSELDLMNQMMAVLEIQAHLDVLVETGEVHLARVSDDGVARYTAR